MATTSSILVAGTGTIRVAPVGTTQPTTPTGTPSAAWVDLGFTSEDGVTYTDSKEVTDVNVWQSFYPVRKIMTGKEMTVAFALREWDENTLPFALGGGTITQPSAGVWKFVPAAAGTIDFRALMIDWVDGIKNFRLIIPQGLVTESVETNLTRTSSAALPITFSALPTSATADPYIFLTDAIAFSS